jgi:hypothetical protein
MATNFVVSFDFNRISTVFLPFCGVTDGVAHISRRRDCFPADIEDHIAGLHAAALTPVRWDPRW